MSSKNESPIATEWHDAAFDLAQGSDSDEERSITVNEVFVGSTVAGQRDSHESDSNGSDRNSSGMGSFVDASNLAESDTSSDQGSSGDISFMMTSKPEEENVVLYGDTNHRNKTTLLGDKYAMVDGSTEKPSCINEGYTAGNEIIRQSSDENESISSSSGVGSFVDMSKELMSSNDKVEVDNMSNNVANVESIKMVPNESDFYDSIRVEHRVPAKRTTTEMSLPVNGSEQNQYNFDIIEENTAVQNTSISKESEIQLTTVRSAQSLSTQNCAYESERNLEVFGCNSNISRESNASQYTNFTTESAITCKHQNTTSANTYSADDFSIMSDFGNLTSGGVPLLTTMQSEEYRKERDRLELRKIALVEMSNAYKTPDERKTVENHLQTNDATQIPLGNSSMVKIQSPPPPPPPRTNAGRNGEVEFEKVGNQKTTCQMNEVNETNYIVVMCENYNVERLIKAGVILLLGGCISSYFAQSTCHFASIMKYIGYYGEPFHLHAGMYEYTSLDSAFTGHAFCLPYDEYYSSTQPIISQIAGKVAIVCGSIASLMLWFYLIFMRTNRICWNLGIFCAAVASVAQLTTFHFFFDDVCAEEMCTIGPGSFMSGVAVMCYIMVAREMYRNRPLSQRRMKKSLGQDESSYSAPNLV